MKRATVWGQGCIGLILLSTLLSCDQKVESIPDDQARAFILELATTAQKQAQQQTVTSGIAQGILTTTWDDNTPDKSRCKQWFSPTATRCDQFEQNHPDQLISRHVVNAKDAMAYYAQDKYFVISPAQQYGNRLNVGIDGRIQTYQSMHKNPLWYQLQRLAQSKGNVTASVMPVSEGQIITIQSISKHQPSEKPKEIFTVKLLRRPDGQLLLQFYQSKTRSRKISTAYNVVTSENQWAQYHGQMYLRHARRTAISPYLKPGLAHHSQTTLWIEKFTSQPIDESVFTLADMQVPDDVTTVDYYTRTISTPGKPIEHMGNPSQ